MVSNGFRHPDMIRMSGDVYERHLNWLWSKCQHLRLKLLKNPWMVIMYFNHDWPGVTSGVTWREKFVRTQFWYFFQSDFWIRTSIACIMREKYPQHCGKHPSPCASRRWRCTMTGRWQTRNRVFLKTPLSRKKTIFCEIFDSEGRARALCRHPRALARNALVSSPSYAL